MNDKSKFKNIGVINSDIGTLYKTISAPLVPNFKTDLVIDYRYSQSDIVVFARDIARQIANHFGLHGIRVLVTFVPELGVPGRVGLSAGNNFSVEVEEKYKFNTNFLSAILAHEVAHIYLYRHKIKIDDTFLNEVFTDTTAAFLGCAWLMLNSSYEETSYLDNQTTVNWFGYISQQEVGYLLAKRDFLLKQDSSAAMIFGRSGEFFAAGRSYFLKSLGRPYVKRSALGNFVYRLKSKLKTGSIIFRCLCCEQQLRIPESDKVLSVHCPACGNDLLCYA